MQLFKTIIAASFDPLNVVADKPQVSADDEGFSACGDPGTTDIVTVTASGGKAPYSYSWSRISAQAQYGPFSPGAPNSNVTAFSAPGNVCDPASPDTETWRCTVTDDFGATRVVDVIVKITWGNLS